MTERPRRILALEPYYGGSHRAFLDGWTAMSRHDWTILNLPPHQWKWRMRHSAVTFAEQVNELVSGGERFDLIFCSDMLNLAEFRGLVHQYVACLPSVVYFHENQLTYPVRHEDERDLHFGMINVTTALAADQVWFNSLFHRDTFFQATEDLLKRMPDHNRLVKVGSLRKKSVIYPQGINRPTARTVMRPDKAPVLLWAARWEHDKNPGLFFDAVERLSKREEEFRLSVIGEQFSEMPVVFETARERFNERILRWGYQESREEYEQALGEADIVVSTANHEFFGVSIMEAVAAGASPLLPDRLAYPELFGPSVSGGSVDHFYNGTVQHLAYRLGELLARRKSGELWSGDGGRRKLAEPYFWDNLTPRLDDGLDLVVCKRM